MGASYQKNRHNVKNLNVNGCQAIINITPGKDWPSSMQSQSNDLFSNVMISSKLDHLFNPGIYGVGSIKIGLDYLYFRFLKQQDQNEFLANLINTNILPYPSSEATDCRSK